MKLRIHQQSVRFRLSPQDIEKLESEKALTESLRFSPQTEWVYGLRLSSHADLKANGEKMEVQLPAKEFSAWLQGSEIEWTMNHSGLELIIEKDLKPNRH